MRWTVVAVPTAEAQLATIWMEAPDPDKVTSASNEIDRQLKDWGDDSGDAYLEQGVLSVPPLTAIYRVYPDDCLVRIVEFRYEP